MSTLGHITAPASSRLFCREEHRQYQYVGTSGTSYPHNWDDPSKLIQHGGGRHAEIMVNYDFVQPFRGGPATPDRNWYAVDELTAQMQTWYPGTGPFANQYGQYIFSSPGKATTTVPTAISTATNMPITPYNFTASATGADCWVMRKGVWNVDVSLNLNGDSTYTGPWQFSVYAKAFRDYDLYSGFRDQLIDTTSVTGYATHTPWTPGAPLEIVCRHNPLWDLTFDLTPDANTPPSMIIDLTFHAIRI